MLPIGVKADNQIKIVRTGDTTYSTLQEAIDNAVSSDTIVLEKGTYIGDVTIDKGVSLKIKGAGKGESIIQGQINIDNKQALTSISDLIISNKGSDAAGIKVTGRSNIALSNSVIQYDGYTESDYGNNDYFTGIWLTKSADESVVAVLNGSEIYAKYGIWVNGQGNDVSVKGSTITGWSPLDISNGTSATSLASDNKVSVENSTLMGVATLTGNGNEYGTIVIGGQSGLELTIEDSTVTNKFVVKNTQDLILFGDAYLPSEDVTIEISNSKLINNDTDGESAVVNYSTEDNTLGGNVLAIDSATQITSANQKNVEIVGDNVLLTLSTIEGDAIIAIPRGMAITDDILSIDEEIDGYDFGGWYTDSSYKNKFVSGTTIEQDTTLYAKFTKKENSVSNVDSNKDIVTPTQTAKNPKTGDINLMMIIITILSGIVGLGVTGRKIALKVK